MINSTRLTKILIKSLNKNYLFNSSIKNLKKYNKGTEGLKYIFTDGKKIYILRLIFDLHFFNKIAYPIDSIATNLLENNFYCTVIFKTKNNSYCITNTKNNFSYFVVEYVKGKVLGSNLSDTNIINITNFLQHLHTKNLNFFKTSHTYSNSIETGVFINYIKKYYPCDFNIVSLLNDLPKCIIYGDIQPRNIILNSYSGKLFFLDLFSSCRYDYRLIDISQFIMDFCILGNSIHKIKYKINFFINLYTSRVPLTKKELIVLPYIVIFLYYNFARTKKKLIEDAPNNKEYQYWYNKSIKGLLLCPKIFNITLSADLIKDL